jgi:hypothetical protein
LVVDKISLPHPNYLGINIRRGLPAGQWADYGIELPDGRGIHIKEYEDHYKVHWDRVAPSRSKIGHMIADAPYLTTGVLAGGYALSQKYW